MTWKAPSQEVDLTCSVRRSPAPAPPPPGALPLLPSSRSAPPLPPTLTPASSPAHPHPPPFSQTPLVLSGSHPNTPARARSGDSCGPGAPWVARGQEGSAPRRAAAPGRWPSAAPRPGAGAAAAPPGGGEGRARGGLGRECRDPGGSLPAAAGLRSAEAPSRVFLLRVRRRRGRRGPARGARRRRLFWLGLSATLRGGGGGGEK